MPQHRNEPAIYSGRVIMMIGNQRGQAVQMDYAVAQSNVASGMARWEDDKTPMPRQLGAEIDRAKADREAKIAADAAHFQNLQNPPKSIDDALISGARPIETIVRDNVAYLAHPFPQIVEMDKDLFDDGAEPGYAVERDENGVAVRFPNASATYQVISENDEFLLCELTEATEPAVEIPADWSARHFLANVTAAKQILGVDRSTKMTKDEAVAIIEEWTRADDPVSIQGTDEGKEAPTNDNGRKLDGEHQEGASAEAAKRAKEKEVEFLDEE